MAVIANRIIEVNKAICSGLFDNPSDDLAIIIVIIAMLEQANPP